MIKDDARQSPGPSAGLYTPGAYELINGSCGLLHEVPTKTIACPAQTDYLPDPSCDEDGAMSTRPALLVLLAATLAVFARS